jgi:hypothetical protein
MTTHAEDFRVTAARTHLQHAAKPDELPHSVLIREAIELRRLLAWMLEVADDFIATDLDETTSTVTTEGGVYLSPADVHHLPRDLVDSL